MTIIDVLLLILCLSSVLFYCYGIYAAIAFWNHPHPITPEFHPAITILKPICGVDSDAYQNLASFCQQDYLEYQIIFAVRDRQDPGIEVVNKIIQQFPDTDIHLVVSDRIIGTNLKVSNLANAVAAAKHEILLIADSDIRVETDYLQRVIQPLKAESVGVVTCLYRSLAQGWVTTLEALGTATDFHAGVLVSNQLQGIKFAFGSTIVIRKQVLELIGGFEAIADYLADDFQLGYLPAQAGYKVVLSDYVVEHVLASSTLVDAIQRQIRWARCIRVSRPWGYLGLLFTYGTVTSLLLLIATGGSVVGWTGLVITWLMRLVMGWVVGVKILNDSVAKKFLWVIPLRDLIHFAIWCYGFVGSTIEWRGQQLKLIKGGKLVAGAMRFG
ncbi:bacteriohopanetetrol glucosamine biosynthesis glycosyltransferase HpnI [aff. Roholtiella sp. LEGE 12411]|uniref:bacteriohopanetetrol glucosamine biosynthesis glycosyltransferase HpnI n=1 Tax=aff. Roholtiella sp. LEGE 12411 TaxID=1828822 RepID=UPI0018810D42|nr:bacteriohopanetetrol glucosamine biosynthesis glycosyltransferase HpnI [aff. Roholtiella sp. LEGE 12411]MBE9037887.1 bacteriohopanetetrol glucosamine biosynthesis glycosyltransferase HpnI [aff. Roholtiella sp. LEGE 12411]